MAFDKYVLGIFLSILRKRCGDCGCASFVPKCLLFPSFRTVLIPFVCPVLVLKSFMVPTGTAQHAGGCDQGKVAAEHCHSWASAWSLPSLWQLTTSLCANFSWCRLGLAQQSGLAENFLRRCSAPEGFENREGKILGTEQSRVPCSAAQISQGSSPFLGCPSLARVSEEEECF